MPLSVENTKAGNKNLNFLEWKMKPLRIRFDKIGWFIRSLDGKIKYLILFDYGLFNKICDKIKYLICKKSGTADSINHDFGKFKIDSSNSLPVKRYWLFIML